MRPERNRMNTNKYASEKNWTYVELIKRILVYLKPFVLPLFLALTVNIAANFFAMIGPDLSGKAIDAIGNDQTATDFNKVYFYCKSLLVLFSLSFVLSYFVSAAMIHIGKQISYHLRKDIQEKLLKLPVSFFDTKQTGDIISSVSYDVDTLNVSICNDFLQFSSSSVVFVFSLVMMVRMSLILTSVFLITMPIAVFITYYRVKVAKPMFRQRSRKLGELNGFAEDILSGLKTIKAYNQEQSMAFRFSLKNREACDAYYQADYQGSKIGPFIGLVNNLSLALIGVVGCMLYVDGKISIGTLSAFVLYSRKFTGPINEFSNILGDVQSAFSAAGRVFSMMDEPEEKEDAADAVELPECRGKVTFLNVRFGYRPGKVILHDLSLDVGQGAMIAIVGQTGAGKSTIINLLMRFYDIQGGCIQIDDKSIYSLKRKNLREKFTMVLQETWIFRGTIFDNIVYGSFDVTMDDVKRVAHAAGIDDYIESLPNQYDTIISDEGTNLSKGQKQLITIARAMLLKTSILILDEATSNVDSRTEQIIQQAMRKLMENKTCFVIAHRLSTIQDADCILVLKDGDIVEKGKHQELLRSKGYYAQLYNAQFQ